MATTMLGGSTPLSGVGADPARDSEQNSPEGNETLSAAAPSRGLAATQASFTGMDAAPANEKKRDPATQTLGMPHTFQSTNAGGEGGEEPLRAPLGSSGLGLPSQRSPASSGEPTPSHSTVSAGRAQLGSTMLGMPSPLAKESTEEGPDRLTPAPGKPLAGTMIGMPSPFAPPAQLHTSSPAPGPLTGTMIGMTTPAASTPGAREEPHTLRTPAGGPSHMGATQLGMPSPLRQVGGVPAPGDASPPATFADLKHKTFTGIGQPELLRGAEQTRQAVVVNQNGEENRFKGTLMGIAQPGIAPTEDMGPSPPGAFDGGSHYSVRTPSRYPSAFPSQPPPARSLWRTTIVVVIGLLLAAAIGGLLAMLNKDPLTVAVQEFSVDEKGRDRLKLNCATCPEGSTLKLGQATAKVEAEQVVFLPERPLQLGKNILAFSLIAPDGEQLEVAPLVLPIAFRVRTDWEGMQHTPPYGRVLVEAPAGSRVTIDGNDVPLKEGRAEFKVELGEKANGENAKAERVTLNLPVEVRLGQSTKTASANLKGVIAPLALSSLGPVHQLNGQPVTVTGRSAPGATITALDQKTTAAKDGSFRLVLGAVTAQNVNIRASGEHLITRTVWAQLVDKAGVPEDARTSFAELKQGGNASFTATVLESRIKEGVTQVLVDVQKGCKKGPCLARLIYAAPAELKEESKVGVVGVASTGDPVTVRVTKFQ